LSWRSTIIRLVLVSVVLTIVIDLFFVPAVSNIELTVFGTFLLQIAALLLALAVAKGARSQVIFRTLLIALLFSLWVVYVLKPVNNLGVAWTLVTILIIESSGFFFAEILSRTEPGKKGKR